MDSSQFFAELASSFGPDGFPRDYICVDTETNGLDITNPQVVPIQLGWVKVVDRQVVDSGSIIADWSKIFENGNMFWYLVEETKKSMKSRGNVYHLDYSLIISKGIHPFAAFSQYFTNIDNNLWFVGHNISSYDIPLIERSAEQVKITYCFPRERVIDTGLIEKARALGSYNPLLVRQRYQQIYSDRSRVRWNLAECVARYGLESSHEQEHEAVYDCLLCHRLIEKWRAIAVEKVESVELAIKRDREDRDRLLKEML